MTREAIVKAASEMNTAHDLLVLLNKIKMDELGEKGFPFIMPQLNYFVNPKRNRASYTTFTIPKRSGGVRTISAPNHMLKSMLTYCNRILQAFYEAPECVTGFVPARSVVDNAERHIGMRCIFNADLKDFFPSISQARVWGALQTRPFSFPREVASVIAGLCCTEVELDGEILNGLPQGSPCSPTLTNIVCHNLDWKLSGLARRFHVRYSRYADDITFSGNEDIFQEGSPFREEFERIVREQNFRLNARKTRLQKRGERQEVTGLVVSERRVNVPREYVRDLDNLLYIWEKYGKNAAFVKFIARYVPKQDRSFTSPVMESVIQGRLQYLRMVRGDADPAWRRLQKRFNRLAERKDGSCGTDVEYLNAYTIDRFENAVGQRISFTDGEGHIAPTIELGEVTYRIQVSRYVRTRLAHVLESGDTGQLDKFRRRYHIAYCHKAGTPEDARFWLLFRFPPKRKEEELSGQDIGSLVNAVTNPPGAAEDGSPGTLSADDVLDALIASDFDLNYLDQWDRTKSN